MGLERTKDLHQEHKSNSINRVQIFWKRQIFSSRNRQTWQIVLDSNTPSFPVHQANKWHYTNPQLCGRPDHNNHRSNDRVKEWHATQHKKHLSTLICTPTHFEWRLNVCYPPKIPPLDSARSHYKCYDDIRRVLKSTGWSRQVPPRGLPYHK